MNQSFTLNAEHLLHPNYVVQPVCGLFFRVESLVLQPTVEKSKVTTYKELM